MARSIVERLVSSAPSLEVWLDSSPLIYQSWVQSMLDKAQPKNRGELEQQLKRLFDPDHPAESLVRGVTTNPKLSLKVIQEEPQFWKAWLKNYLHSHPSDDVEHVFWQMYKEVVRRGAQMMLPLYEASGYRYGYLSGQLDPRNLFDKEKMLAQAEELIVLAPNIMVKVPGSAQGVEVLRILTARGIPTNCTLAYTVPQYITVAKAIQKGMLEAQANGVDLTRWRAVTTAMQARWENASIFNEQAAAAGVKLTPEHKSMASSAIFKHAYHLYRSRNYPSKMLNCSLRTGPDVNGQRRIWHLEETAGADAVFTLPLVYLDELYHDFFDASYIEFTPAIWRDIPANYWDDLRKIPYFVQSFEEDGMQPEEFNTLQPLLNTYKEFSGATEEMVAFVRELMQPNHQG